MTNKLILILCLCLVGCANTKLQSIKGKGSTELESIKGMPVTKVRENGHEMWTYRGEGCTEIVFFNALGQVSDLKELGECKIQE